MKTLHTTSLGIVLGAFMLFSHTAEAASFFFVPATGTYGVGAKITVDLKIDSEGVGMNAGQATVRFPKETLQVSSIDKTNSTFNFWLTEPTFSNQDGVISFAGGTPYGISGASMQILRITFISKGSGAAPITVVDAAVTASDGSGTNILSKTTDATLTISPTGGATTAVPAVVPVPQQIVRETVSASGLPARPTITVPLYPDPSHWYNVENLFTVRWDLPRDITGISTSLNKQPNSTPGESSEGLFDSKTFDALPEGTWYLHIRFRNSVGWGPAVHYRLAVDTKSPLPFEVSSSESEKSDTPHQNLEFRTSDALSGLSSYQIKVNNEDWITIPAQDFSGKYQLTFSEPGKHHIIIKALDQAGNSIENSIDHEITPIASPTFTFVSKQIFSGEPTGVSVSGTALPDTYVMLMLKMGESRIASSTIKSNIQGNWEYTFTDILRNGTYTVTAQNKDARGALSLVIPSPQIQVTEKPLFQLGPISIGTRGSLILLLLILIGGSISGWWFYNTRRERTALRVGVAESDTAKAFNMIKADMEKLDKARSTPTPVDDEFIAKKMREDVNRMENYIKQEINKAKE